MTTLGKSITGIIIIGLLVAGGYYVSRSSDMKEIAQETPLETTKASTTETTKIEEVKPAGKKMAFSQFLKQGGAYMCTVNQTVNNTTSQGTVYIDGTRTRGEFSIRVEGQSMTSTFIVLDGYTYTWTSMMPTAGFKIKNTEGTTTGPQGTPTSNTWNADQIGDYDCTSWTVDPSKFILPTSVKFTLMGN
jgi:hypothetical protein